MLGRNQRRIDQFWSKVNKTSDCWLWEGYINKTWGYGYVSILGVVWRVHRLSYTLLRGEIPEGLHIDHLCKNRLCVNPDHLEVVTNAQNVLRGDGPTAINARKKICIRGHRLEGDNLYITPSGYRNCRKCRTKSANRWKYARQTA